MFEWLQQFADQLMDYLDRILQALDPSWLLYEAMLWVVDLLPQGGGALRQTIHEFVYSLDPILRFIGFLDNFINVFALISVLSSILTIETALVIFRVWRAAKSAVPFAG